MVPEIAAPRRRVPGGAAMTWLIAERAAVESLRDTFSLLAGLVLAVPVPLVVGLLVVRPVAESGSESELGAAIAAFLLVVGVLPAFAAVGVASGQFAGEMERGILTPLLASPAGNLAIFAGKVLGAILPSLLYATVAEVIYLCGLAALVGLAAVRLLPFWLLAGTLLFILAVTGFAAVVASLISSRVRTFNAAQQLGGLVLMPVWGAIFALAARVRDAGPLGLFGAALTLLLVDAALAALSAATWRREEVLAHR